ncbi:MAG: response regulator [Candidatus Omnitrophota bacterium]
MKKKILIADDDPVTVALVSGGLLGGGYEVITAKDGPEAMEKAKASMPDLIIMDVLMPGMDGVDVGGVLQEDVRTHHIPVIYLTGLAPREESVLEQDLDPAMVLNKPVDMPLLLERVRKLIAGTGA